MTRRPVPALKLPAAPQPAQLRAEEIARRLALRSAPPDIPNRTMKLAMPDSEHISELIEMFKRSGVLPYLRRRFRPKRGKHSRLPTLALLVGMFYCGGEWNTYWRLNLAKFFASLHPNDAVRLGIHSIEQLFAPLTYTIVCKQAARLERGLHAGWVDEDGTHCNLKWLTQSVLRGTVPSEDLSRVYSVALDTTDVPTRAKRRLWKDDDEPLSEEEIVKLNEPVRPLKGGKPRRFTRTTNLIGHRRTNGKRILSKDIDAGCGHRNRGGDHEEGNFFGSHLTVAIAVKNRKLTGSRKRIKFGPDIAGYAVGMDFCPAGTSASKTGIATFKSARRLCPGIDDIVVDRGFSQLGPTFNAAMHRFGSHVTMDVKKPDIATAKPVRLGPSGYPAFVHAGTFLHAFTPRQHRVPAGGLSKKQREKFYADREKFALTVNQRLPNGAVQFESPIHKGSFNIDPNKTTGAKQKTVYPAPNDFHAHFGKVPDEILHQRYISVTAKELHYHQEPHFGTPPQKQSYGRRQPSENVFSQLKQAAGLNNKLCLTVNPGARHISALARVVWYNLALALKAKQEKQARRSADKAQPKKYIPLRFVAPDSRGPAELCTESPAVAESRAPP